MTHLSNKVISCGRCNNCGESTVTAISEHEAKQIIEVCKKEFITYINNIGLSADGTRAVINAINSVE